jgi:hypothetical protein
MAEQEQANAAAANTPTTPEHRDEELEIPYSCQHLANLHESIKLAHTNALECGHKSEHPPVRKFAHKMTTMLGKSGNEARAIHEKEYPDIEGGYEELPEVHPAAKKPEGETRIEEAETAEGEREKKPMADEEKPGEEGKDEEKPKKEEKPPTKEEEEKGGKGGKAMTGKGMHTGDAVNETLSPIHHVADWLESQGKTHPDRMMRDLHMQHAQSLRAYCQKMCTKDDMGEGEEGEGAPMEEMDEHQMKGIVPFIQKLDSKLASIEARRSGTAAS